MCRKLRQKLPVIFQRAKSRILRGCGGRPQDNTSNLSRPRTWIEMNSSPLSPALTWPCPERRGVTMGCLYLEIEGQSCLVGSVDQGLMKNGRIYLLDRMTQKRARNDNYLSHFFPIATLPGIFQPITPKKTLQTFWPNYRLSTVIGLDRLSYDLVCDGRCCLPYFRGFFFCFRIRFALIWQWPFFFL